MALLTITVFGSCLQIDLNLQYYFVIFLKGIFYVPCFISIPNNHGLRPSNIIVLSKQFIEAHQIERFDQK